MDDITNNPNYLLNLERNAHDDALVEILIHKINNALLYFVIDEERRLGNPEFKEGIRFDELIEKAYESLSHYFSCGHCNIYAYILCKVFGPYAQTYDNGKHIVTKLGDNYYDFDGINYKVKDDEHLKLYEKEYLLEPMYALLGNYDKEIDPILINIGVNTATKYIADYTQNIRKKKDLQVNL